jgi:hypothetical protein
MTNILLWPIFNVFFVRLDCLHVVDHKGVLGKIWGSAVWSLIRCPEEFAKVFPNCANQGERIAAIDGHLKLWQKQYRTANRLPEIKLTTFFGDGSTLRDYPVLQGPGVKAAGEKENRFWLRALLGRFLNLDEGSLFAYHRHRCVEKLCAWYDVIVGGSYVLTAAEYRAQRDHCIECLRSYQWLAWNARCSGFAEFQIVPKFHYFAEMSLQARLLNPRFCQTYRGESMVGRVAQIWKRSLNGPYEASVQKVILSKYCLGVEVGLTDIG